MYTGWLFVVIVKFYKGREGNSCPGKCQNWPVANLFFSQETLKALAFIKICYCVYVTFWALWQPVRIWLLLLPCFLRP